MILPQRIMLVYNGVSDYFIVFTLFTSDTLLSLSYIANSSNK
ncbi:hypothetical protein PCIT_b0091 [Pseudoalteromonas citrea]|uniref:Uncharacterized protein n=1 Tax=Pseudoalteromonas citrea TaxID=43655 RepID=A0AAD4ADX3_9GAMM|nr:hypothetical protein PCIT_b0091 [Pseudoalteromonas citrea]